MKMFYDQSSDTWNVYISTRSGLKKIAEFKEAADALDFMSHVE